MNIITPLYEDVLPHGLIGNKEDISTARIVSTIGQAQTLDGTVLIADNLQEVISFYRESFGYKSLTLTAANDAEAMIGVNNKMKVEHKGKFIDCTKMSFEELSVARVSVCPEDELYKCATAALHQLLKNFPFITPDSAIADLYKANESLNLQWLLKKANEIIDRKKARILKAKSITKDKDQKSTWSKIFKMPDFMEGNYFNCSDTGYGKTELNEKIIKHCMDNGLKVLYVVHRITIADNSINIPGVTHYDKIMPGTEDDIKCLKIVANSIIKRNLQGFMDSVDVVILEEGKQGLDFIATGTVEQRDKVYETLKKVCENAKSIIVSDADSNDRTLEFIKDCTGQEIRLMHGHMDFSDKTISMITYKQALGEIDQLVGSETIMIATDSKGQADRLFSKYKNNDDVSAIVITADNIRNAEIQEFLENINSNEQYNLVIYSPAITSSLSIIFDRYKLHYGLFQGIVTATDAVQMLRRNRPCANFRVGIRSRKEHMIDDLGELTPDDATEIDVFIAKVEAEANYNRNNIQAAFYFCAQHEGFNVVTSNDVSSVAIGETADRSATTIESNDFKRRMLTTVAADSTYNAEAMINGGESASADADAIERAKIEKATGKSDLTRKDLANYGRNRLTTFVKNSELLRANRESCVLIDNGDSGPDRDRKKFTIHHDFFNKIFDKLGLCPFTGEGSFTVEDANALLAELMIDRKKFNKMRFDKKLPTKLPTNGTRTVNQMLEQFGLETDPSEGSGRVRYYSITQSSIDMMNEYLTNRQWSELEVVKSRASYITR